jgi:hypothetical protein
MLFAFKFDGVQKGRSGSVIPPIAVNNLYTPCFVGCEARGIWRPGMLNARRFSIGHAKHTRETVALIRDLLNFPRDLREHRSNPGDVRIIDAG